MTTKKPSSTTQIIALCNANSATLGEVVQLVKDVDEQARVRYSDLCNRLDQLEAKVAAVAKGRKTGGRKTGGSSNSVETPKGPKSYSNSMYYFKGEYAKEPAKIKEAYCTEDMVAALKAHCESNEKLKGLAGDRRLKAEASWLWNTYVKSATGDDDDVKSAKTKIRDAVRRDYNAHKVAITKQNNTPAAKEADKK